MNFKPKKMKRGLGPDNIQEYVWKHALVYAKDRDVEIKRLKYAIKELQRELKSCRRCGIVDPIFPEDATACHVCGCYTSCSREGCVPFVCSLCGAECCWDCAYPCNEPLGHLVCILCSGTQQCYCCYLFKREVIVGCATHPLQQVEMPEIGKVFACAKHATPNGWGEVEPHIDKALRLTAYYSSIQHMQERIHPMP